MTRRRPTWPDRKGAGVALRTRLLGGNRKRAATRLGMSEEAVPALYLESVDWAQQIPSGRTEAESRPA